MKLFTNKLKTLYRHWLSGFLIVLPALASADANLHSLATATPTPTNAVAATDIKDTGGCPALSKSGPSTVDEHGKCAHPAVPAQQTGSRSLSITGGTVNGGTLHGKIVANGTVFNNTTIENHQKTALNNCTLNNCRIVASAGTASEEPKLEAQAVPGATSGHQAALDPAPPQAKDTMADQPQTHDQGPAVGPASEGSKHAQRSAPKVDQSRIAPPKIFHHDDEIRAVGPTERQGPESAEFLDRNRKNADTLRRDMMSSSPELFRDNLDLGSLKPNFSAGQSDMVLDAQMGFLKVGGKNELGQSTVYDRWGNYLGVLMSDPTSGTDLGNGQKSSGDLLLNFDKGYSVNGKEIAAPGFLKSLTTGNVYDSEGKFWGGVLTDGRVFNNSFTFQKLNLSHLGQNQIDKRFQ